VITDSWHGSAPVGRSPTLLRALLKGTPPCSGDWTGDYCHDDEGSRTSGLGTHRLLVLKILNLVMFLNSSIWKGNKEKEKEKNSVGFWHAADSSAHTNWPRPRTSTGLASGSTRASSRAPAPLRVRQA